ncbi:hypothetical protein GQ607_011492 [Colletotrichum asianum]|uniref:Uncharacterized protein n=1 Tax=Colletotrichum asianum TaxID=702518 RepID=A0A8H3W677_9PEZI|nr:hypothetical protein GQ607_011492 [Colletotrichum asianum]
MSHTLCPQEAHSETSIEMPRPIPPLLRVPASRIGRPIPASRNIISSSPDHTNHHCTKVLRTSKSC